MAQFKMMLRSLLAAGAIATSLCACGGAADPAPGAVSVSKTASWTNVSVRAMDGAININWDKPAGSSLGAAPAAYNVYCSTSTIGIVQEGNRIATNYLGQSFDHTNVNNGQRYYYVVTQVTPTGEGPASRTVSATPQAALPAPPLGIKVTAGDSSAQLEFLVPSPPYPANVSYNLYRSTSRSGFTGGDLLKGNIPFATPTGYSDQTLANGAIYYYAVTTVVAGKESGFSPVASVQPQAKAAKIDSSATQLASFASPTDFSAAPGDGSCTVTWTDVGTVSISAPDPAATPTAVPCYILYWSDSPDVLGNVKGQVDDVAKSLTKDGNGSFSYRLAGLKNGAMVYLGLVAAVKGTDGAPIPGRFTSGPTVSVTPAKQTPAVPSGVAATQGDQQVALAWNKDTSGLARVTYNIYFSTTAPASPAELVAKGTLRNGADSSKAYFTHTGLDAGKTYYYVITAVAEGESAPSNIVSVTL